MIPRVVTGRREWWTVAAPCVDEVEQCLGDWMLSHRGDERDADVVQEDVDVEEIQACEISPGQMT